MPDEFWRQLRERLRVIQFPPQMLVNDEMLRAWNARADELYGQFRYETEMFVTGKESTSTPTPEQLEELRQYLHARLSQQFENLLLYGQERAPGEVGHQYEDGSIEAAYRERDTE